LTPNARDVSVAGKVAQRGRSRLLCGHSEEVRAASDEGVHGRSPAVPEADWK